MSHTNGRDPGSWKEVGQFALLLVLMVALLNLFDEDADAAEERYYDGVSTELYRSIA